MNLQVDTTYFGVSKLQWFKDDKEKTTNNIREGGLRGKANNSS